MNPVERFFRASAGTLIVTCAVGCADTDTRPQPQVVFAVFDPAAQPPQIPLPNDLTGQPAPRDTPAVAQFSGPIEPASIGPQSVLVIDTTTQGLVAGVTPSFDSATNRLVLTPPTAGWPVGHRIAVALRGSPGGLAGVGQLPVVATPAFFFARSPEPLVTCTSPTDCKSATPALSDQQAAALEELRKALAPLITALEALGIPRDQLALAWTFTVGPGARDGGVALDGGLPDAASAADAAAGGGGL